MNSFDLLRLLAAVAVIFHHTAPLNGSPVLRVFSTDFGELGVGVFFVISGFLVAASWRRAPHLVPFLKKRVLRIEPALVASLALTALFLGAFVTTLPPAAYLTDPQVWLYVGRNALLYPVTYRLPGVFAANPLPDTVNGALWTLRLEFSCYLGVAALGVAGQLKRPVVAVLAIAAGAAFVVLHILRPDLRSSDPMRLADLAALDGFLFLAGVFLNLRDRPAPLWAAALLAPLLMTPAWIFGLPLLVVALGSLRSVRLPADISYGLYIYAFPLQQLLAAHGRLTFATALLATAPVALASWFLVEKPALRLKPAANLDGAEPATDP